MGVVTGEGAPLLEKTGSAELGKSLDRPILEDHSRQREHGVRMYRGR